MVIGSRRENCFRAGTDKPPPHAQPMHKNAAMFSGSGGTMTTSMKEPTTAVTIIGPKIDGFGMCSTFAIGCPTATSAGTSSHIHQ